MTTLTAPQLTWLHTQLGDEPADAELQTRFDDLGSLRDVAIQVLTARRRELLDSPLSSTLQGVGTINASENVKALERDIAGLIRLDDDPTDDPDEDDSPIAQHTDGFQVQQIVRSRRR